jgi:hypothetical protein
MHTIREKITVPDDCSVNSVTKYLKEQLITLSRPLSYQEEEEWRLKRESRITEEDKKMEKPRSRSQRRPSSKQSGRKKLSDDDQKKLEEEERKKQEEENNKRRRQEEIEKLEQFPAFNVDDVAAITNYVVTGLLQHFHLYRTVFRNEQGRDVSKYNAFIETLPEFSIPLDKGLEEEQYVKKKEEEKQLTEELEQTTQRELEEKLKRDAEEAQEAYQRELEEKKSPKLTTDQLQEIANYLKFHIEKDIDGRRDDLLSRIIVLQSQFEEKTRKGSVKSK